MWFACLTFPLVFISFDNWRERENSDKENQCQPLDGISSRYFESSNENTMFNSTELWSIDLMKNHNNQMCKFTLVSIIDTIHSSHTERCVCVLWILRCLKSMTRYVMLHALHTYNKYPMIYIVCISMVSSDDITIAMTTVHIYLWLDVWYE